MIAIVNVSPNPSPTGPHPYELRINSKVIATFMHRREDDLATCLRKASEAAIRAQRDSDRELLMKLRAFLDEHHS